MMIVSSLRLKKYFLGEFPTFNVQFDEYFDNFSFTSTPDLLGSRAQQQRQIQSQLRKYEM